MNPINHLQASLRTPSANRNGHLYFVTVQYVHLAKLHVFYTLEDFCSQLWVSEERHANNQLHHHIFMRTKEPYLASDIYEIMRDVYEITTPNNSIRVVSGTPASSIKISRRIDIQSVRNVRAVIRYITKSDVNFCQKNINEMDLSFGYKMG